LIPVDKFIKIEDIPGFGQLDLPDELCLIFLFWFSCDWILFSMVLEYIYVIELLGIRMTKKIIARFEYLKTIPIPICPSGKNLPSLSQSH
jgi:hypothetical protein